MSIQATDISKTFGQTKALDHINLRVDDGELLALVGPSGSGKTTLLRIFAGLESPDPGAGEIRFRGEDVTRLSARQRKVGMVFQHYALFRHMSVRDNIAFGLSVRPRKERPSRRAINALVDDLLERVQLPGYAHRLPAQLSGGQRQRVALARALAIEPKVLLLDEPFGALDAKVRKDLRRWLRQFHEQMRLTTVFVTHDQEEALELADRVVVMNHARIEQVGTPQEVFDHPGSPFVIEFMGKVNRLSSGFGSPRSTDQRQRLYVRPHDIEILANPSSSPLKARVLHVFSAGSVGNVFLERLDVAEALEAEISRSELDALQLRPGQEVALRFRHIRLFAKQPDGQQIFVETEPEQTAAPFSSPNGASRLSEAGLPARSRSAVADRMIP